VVVDCPIRNAKASFNAGLADLVDNFDCCFHALNIREKKLASSENIACASQFYRAI
jgi:hypothetical protein